MSEQPETQPTLVSSRPLADAAKQVGDVGDRWSWTEPCAWTERMLTALESGVKGGRWFSLIDKVYDRVHLRAAFGRVARNGGAAGVDHVTIEQYEARLPEYLTRLSEALRSSTYQPQAVRRVWIEKLGSSEKRPLGIPTVQDRAVQTALRNVLEPIFERDFAEQSYGFRPGRGCKNALRRVDHLLKQGYRYVVDADLKSYFDTIDHEKLLALIESKVSDSRVLELIRMFLKQGVLDGLDEWTPVSGSPQGAVISPLLSNVYLDPLDHLMSGLGFEMVRYADDLVILCRSRSDANRALALLQQWVSEAGLTLHPTKTKVVDAVEVGFEFLGYRFVEGHHGPRAKSLKKFKDTIRRKTRRRCSGQSLSHIIDDVNRTLRGWFEYFQHSSIHDHLFHNLDAWLRMRLRSILRERLGLRGRGRGIDHQRWPNAFFTEHGLFSLKTAHVLACQSSRR